jgi:WD40 repeat protein
MSGTLAAKLCDDNALGTTALHKKLLGELQDVDVSADGTRLVTVHNDRNPCADVWTKAEPQPSPLYTPVRVWVLRTGKRLFALEGLRRGVETARFSPDGRLIVTIGAQTYHNAEVRDGKYLGRSGNHGTGLTAVDLWDAGNGKHVRSLIPEMKGGGRVVAWSPDGRRILTNVHSPKSKATADIYDAASGERVCSLSCDSGYISRAAFSPDGKLVLGYRVLGYSSSIVQGEMVDVWDAATGAHRMTLRGHTGDVTAAEFSPDSRLILTTSTDSTARLWDAATGEEKEVLRGHRHVVRAGRFSPDGRWVATASTDGTARIWSTATGQEWLTLPPVHGIAYLRVEFSADSQRLLTASTDGTARIWPVDPLPLAASRKPRKLTDEERAQFQVQTTP